MLSRLVRNANTTHKQAYLRVPFLIINELVSNSFKYAFPEGTGEVCIELWSDNEPNYVLIVSDNGIGFPKHIDFENTKSLGLQLVNALTDQLEGSLELNAQNGTEFKIKFTK